MKFLNATVNVVIKGQTVQCEFGTRVVIVTFDGRSTAVPRKGLPTYRTLSPCLTHCEYAFHIASRMRQPPPPAKKKRRKRKAGATA